MERTLADFFTHDHHEVDHHWARVEEAAESGDADAVRAAFDTFDGAQRQHIAMEEDVLFPAFENATGMTQGPTAVMRDEHTQMRGLLDQMRAALVSGDTQEMIDQGDTLLMLIQQHNQKEEAVLYPMAEQVLGAQWVELHGKLGKK
ncbi:hemerythrin domain-containing protein [bacterium]|nr:hemerythrin domain-containing protein [bacterium]